jgi:CRP-like cAMP-binding protein
MHCSIRNLMLFSDLPEAAFSARLSPIEHFIFSEGATLFEEGRNDGAVYSIRSGIVKLSSRNSDGEQRIVRLLGAGATIGLELLEAGRHYQHTAIALNDVDACRIPVDTIFELETGFPEICQQIRRRLQAQLDRADQWIVTLGTGPAKKRIAHLLLLMMQYSTKDNGDITLLGGMDTAAIIGSSPETVSRILAGMKRKGVLKKVSANLYRGDSQALEAIIKEVG